ncbi:threonine aldolase family protein [Wansuia hejianensis]|uniref:Low specificity L-threonine aldolase n=1 Tax=Wansuia hejianensis TaxID=2763667 RepID=A0A926EXY0_9FIRM|nr:low specificity L-threonine aldolase [Wansuia hejianensis]MBC8591011.1 low specificity L-threonine aldolase [Wansuia hejianensis]
MRMFKSDNNSGVHPKILESIISANTGHDNPYGYDKYSVEAKKKIRELFEKEVDIYFVTTGTAANIIGLSCLLEPFEAVVCTDTAHINTDEGGSFERISGSKILYTEGKDGKLEIEDIKPFLTVKGDEHRVQPRIISISQTTETGTLYTVEEIKALADFAHDNHMLLHIDGARIANAVVALNTSFKEMITDTGVDLLSFGGTKNGMMVGEAIISFNNDLTKDLKYYRKQGMQLLSKMRFISAQFIGYLEGELWRENAQNANSMGQYLANELSKLKGVTVKEGLMTNMIFANMNKKIIDELQEKFGFYTIDEDTNLVRLVTSFDTTKEDIDRFIEAIKEVN